MQGTLSINVTVSLPVLLQLCRPLESVETPNPVREVWAMVDEYMVTEAEVSFIKLLET